MPKILDNNGNLRTTHLTGCPKCCTPNPKKDLATTAVFDNEGRWYYAAKFTCAASKCGHTWTDKILI